MWEQPGSTSKCSTIHLLHREPQNWLLVTRVNRLSVPRVEAQLRASPSAGHRRTATVTLFTVGRPGTALRWRLSRDDEANSRGGASGDRSPHSRREESPFQQTLLGNEDMCIVYIVSLSQLSLAWTRFKPQSSYSRKACATLSHMQHHQVRTLPSVRAFGFCVVHATTRETLQGVFAGGVSQIFTACGCCGRLRYSLGSSPPILACW